MSTVMARMIELKTPLGKDLLFRSLRGGEGLGRCSSFELSALSTRRDINPNDLLGKIVTVKLELLKGKFRYFNGYVTRFAQGDTIGRHYEYNMTVSAWLWFLTRTTDCQIFQEKTVPEIIKQVFGDHKMAVFEDGLTASYRQREYCVQYRETDFDFVSRLMEEEGIYYYFEHSEDKHTLKLVDCDSGYKKLEGKESIAYYPPDRAPQGDEEFIYAFRQNQRIQPGSVALHSFDFVKPKSDLGVKAKNVQSHDHADYEIFDYAGDYEQADHGDHYVRLRMDELHSDFDRCEAECNVREITVGRLFDLTNAPRREQEKEYLIVSADWDIQNNTYETGTNEDAVYRCSMSLLQSRQQFRPARTTPRPTMGGPQTAMVVGPAGEEIWCDKHGRVKVQFHWDRYGKKDENSSCWIRVSQPWAGKDWGTVSIPRIGQEVVVDFLEGDPDQPLITGRVYNGDNPPPYPLPGAAVISGIKTKTHKGTGYNEISADDTAGKEKITIHGQYDMNTTIQHDETHTVVGGNRQMTVKAGTNTETVKGNASLTVQSGTRSVSVSGGDYTATASAAVKLHGQGSGLTATGNPNVDITGQSTLTITSPDVDMGNAKIKIHGTKIELVTAGGSITIDGSGITLQGNVIKSGATGDHEITGAKVALSGGSGSIELAGPGATMSGSKVTVSGAGTTEITGGVVKIN